MSICFLNDKYLDLQEAKISPLDRGFLFGDAIYEVIIAVNKNCLLYTSPSPRDA